MPESPGPERCPDGFVFVCTHTVSMTLGEQKAPRVKCILRKTQPCYAHDIMIKLASIKSQLAPAIQEALNDMDSERFKCFAYPITILAAPSIADDPKSPWRPSNEEHGALLQVYAQGVQEELRDLLSENKFIQHETKGFYLRLRKRGNQYKVKKVEAVVEPVRNQQLLERYRQTNVVSAFYKGVYQYTYEQQKDFISKAWWMKDPQVREALSGYDDKYDAGFHTTSHTPSGVLVTSSGSVPVTAKVKDDDWD